MSSGTLRVLGAVGAFVVVGLVVVQVGHAAPRWAAPQAATTDAALPQTVEFNRDIRPILSDKCFQCHGPGTQLATLRFDLEEGAKKALPDGKFAVVAGDPANSEMLKRIAATNPVIRMPRSQGGAAAGQPLTDQQTALLRRWIEQGAKWEKHWSFNPPARPAVPKVKDAKWVKNPIDAFVLNRLEREGLAPSSSADRGILLRRVSLDLTGLPPTLAELDAFLADKSPNAYEKVVDRLLRSPQYGERMASQWLDLARYADTNGYQTDYERYMWRWRDWVIDAFNRNMPYDQFTIEQLAGDLLPNPTQDQLIATGFNRNHRTNAEGGVVPEEYAVEYVVDRVDTTTTAFLGMTIGCARCHNHKYDPVTQKEYYQLFSYFNNVPERGRGRQVGNSPPYITAPTAEQAVQLKKLDDELAAAQKAFANLRTEVNREQQAWERSLTASTDLTWAPSRGMVAYYPLDSDLTAKVAVAPNGKPLPLKPLSGLQGPKGPRYEREDGGAGGADPVPADQADAKQPAQAPEARFEPGAMGSAARFDGQSFLQGGDIVGFGNFGVYDDPYTITAWINPTSDTGAIVTKAEDFPEPNGHGLNLKNGKINYNYVAKWVDEGIRLQTERSVTLNQWHQVTLTYDGSRYASGVKVYVDGEEWKWQIVLDDFNSAAGPRREPLRIGAGGGPENRFKGDIDDVRIYNRALSAAEAAVLNDRTPVNAIAAMPEASRTQAQADKIRGYFLEHAAADYVKDAERQAIDAQAKRDKYYAGLPTVMVMEEMSPPRQSHLLIRGAYDRPGDSVSPALPVILAPSPTAYAPNRLGLAKWLVDPANPLMARVTVNRFWQMYFGTGIVKTPEDFGSQGEAPSHPELLDWLATEFIRTGWNVKALQKSMVMSAAYQQTSKVTPALLEKDPGNRLLARGPNFRLPAEMIRDQALAISGLLTSRVGGPSVRPYQPDGLWNEVGGGTRYVQDHGENLYRRGIYVYRKRSSPPPSLANFDASTREAHQARLTVTNTPLQALDLMNDVTYVETARMLAQRMMKQGGVSPRDRIAFAFRLATARLPEAAETELLLGALAEDLARFKAKPDAALKFVKQGEAPRDEQLDVPELAAYTSVASLILNLDETVTKE